MRDNSVASQRCQCDVGRVWRDRHEQATRCLRIEQQVLVFRRNARVERRAVADEGTIVFQPGGKMAIAGGFYSARKVVEGGVIEFKRNNVYAARGIAERHL